MKWLNQYIELNTNSTLTALFLFSILSVFCSTIIIIIYFKMKSLRTLIYRFFLHVAINEWISRISYLFLFLFDTNRNNYNIYMFHLGSNLIFFTDTNIILLVTFACFGMHQLIIKQNVKLSDKFNKISIFLYISSAIFTAIFYSFTFGERVDKSENKIDSNLYRNIIGLNFVTDYYDPSLSSILYVNFIYIPLLIISFVFIFLIQGFVKDRGSIGGKINEEDEVNKDKTIKSSLKLRTFKLKLLAYPLLNLAYIGPVLLYAWMEYYYLTHLDERRERISMLRVRYSFYNIYIFMNSIRGWIFFKEFTNNEKIKEYLFKKYFYFDLFKTIDQINEDELNLNPKSSIAIESNTKSFIKLENEIKANFDSSFDIIRKKRKKDNEKKNKKEEKEMNELNDDARKALVQAGLINDEEEDNSDEDDDNDEEEKKLKQSS